MAYLGHGTIVTPSSTDTENKRFAQCALIAHAGVAAIFFLVESCSVYQSAHAIVNYPDWLATRTLHCEYLYV